MGLRRREGPTNMDFVNKILQGDSRLLLPAIPERYFNVCVTSSPYWGLRDYETIPIEWPEVIYTPMYGLPTVTIHGMVCQLGLETDPAAYVAHLILIFREVWRVLKDDGTLWLNLGDNYGHGGRHGIPAKQLAGIPWRVALALQADGWYLRSDIIWNKPNAMPESVKDRPTKAHEYIFLLTKSEKYYYDHDAIKEKATQPVGAAKITGSQDKQRQLRRNMEGSTLGTNQGSEYRNRRSVWNVATKPFKDAHFAVFPPDLIKPCILAGCPEGGIVLDPFMGSGTTGATALELGRNFTGIDLNQRYITDIAEPRIKGKERVF